MRHHIDYITPGIALREVTGVGKKSNIQKRFQNGDPPPVLGPIAMPLEQLLGGLFDFCDIAITPQCIKGKSSRSNTTLYLILTIPDMYNITEGKKSTKGNELGIFESIGDVYSQEDLDLFFQSFAR